MYTSAKKISKTAIIYTFVTLFCVLFGAVYEIFSYEVYSYFMIYAFVFPLVLGVLPFLFLSHSGKAKPVPLIAGMFYHFGTAVLTVGSLMTGVLEIYGTDNILTTVYWITGAILIATGAVLYLTARNTVPAKVNNPVQ